MKTSSIKFFGVLSEPGGGFPFYSFIVGKMFSRKMMLKMAVNADSYCNILRNLRKAIQRKRPGLLTKGVLLLHDNAWFRQQPKEFYAADFQGLVKRWDKCLNVQLDYVKK
jgi:hypothetical protein